MLEQKKMVCEHTYSLIQSFIGQQVMIQLNILNIAEYSIILNCTKRINNHNNHSQNGLWSININGKQIQLLMPQLIVCPYSEINVIISRVLVVKCHNIGESTIAYRYSTESRLSSHYCLNKKLNLEIDYSKEKDFYLGQECILVQKMIQKMKNSQKYINNHHKNSNYNSNNLLPIMLHQLECISDGYKRKSPQLLILDLSAGINQLGKELRIKTTTNNNQCSPLLRIASYYPSKMVNPHLHLPVKLKAKHRYVFVQGAYQYFHYHDQQFNDQSWGCAYRAMQTLLSWFNLQGYLHLLEMPSISTIQRTLDRISLSKLAGTSEWIGATEVSYMITQLTGYNCRIIHVPNGSNIIDYCQQFEEHLLTYGTPIMYGGGQYAYSIVGMNYSWQLGECQFCILDPHYVGSDTAGEVISGKGVSWKKPKQMFKEGIFYNMCMPILK